MPHPPARGPSPSTRALLFLFLLLAQQGSQAQEDPLPERPPSNGGTPTASQEEPPPPEMEYRTPRAGKAYSTKLLGEEIHVEARDRRETLALSLGSVYFTPKVGEERFVPFAAIYWRRFWEERRLRAVVSGFVNELDYAEQFAWLDLLLHLENNTIPFPSSEIVDGEELEYTALRWGSGGAWLGAGLRILVPPGEVDNELKIGCYYRASYMYFSGVRETGKIDGLPVAMVNVPPDTYVHGLHVRASLDMLERNLLELPHLGLAAGGDLSFLRRDRWEDLGSFDGTGQRQFPSRRTRDFLKLSGHLVVASTLPFLSERHVILLRIHGGWAPDGDLDRFNAFRLGGGPLPTEANDLARSPYPGAMFNQFAVRYYGIATLEYRLELLFFVYLHLRATYAVVKAPTFRSTLGPPGPVRLRSEKGLAFSAALTTGFLWESSLYLDYTYDSGVVRGGERGHTLLLLWSKSL